MPQIYGARLRGGSDYPLAHMRERGQTAPSVGAAGTPSPMAAKVSGRTRIAGMARSYRELQHGAFGELARVAIGRVRRAHQESAASAGAHGAPYGVRSVTLERRSLNPTRYWGIVLKNHCARLCSVAMSRSAVAAEYGPGLPSLARVLSGLLAIGQQAAGQALDVAGLGDGRVHRMIRALGAAFQ